MDFSRVLGFQKHMRASVVIFSAAKVAIFMPKITLNLQDQTLHGTRNWVILLCKLSYLLLLFFVNWVFVFILLCLVFVFRVSCVKLERSWSLRVAAQVLTLKRISLCGALPSLARMRHHGKVILSFPR